MTNDELRKLAESATPGPWHAPGLGEVHAADHRTIVDTNCKTGIAEIVPPDPNEPIDEQIGCGTDADAAYIAACSPDRIIRLLDEHARMKTLVELIAGNEANCCWSDFWLCDHQRARAVLNSLSKENP